MTDPPQLDLPLPLRGFRLLEVAVRPSVNEAARRTMTSLDVSNPLFFATPAKFRAWLRSNHAKATEQWVGFWKKESGKASITWPQSVDEALCFGWIDGLRKSIDDERYAIRFTPRRTGSIWSAVNTRRAQQLIEEGRMQPAGLRAFEARSEERTAVYSFDRKTEPELTGEESSAFRSNASAWSWFESQPPGYRRTALHWVVSARREATRRSRLATLIEDSSKGLRIAPLRR